MSDASPPSSQLPPPTGSSSAPFIVVAVVLVVVMGGLVCWKMKSNDAPATPSATAPASGPTTVRPPNMDAPPPPPPDDPTPSASTPNAKKPGPGGGPVSACGPDCSGTPSAGTRGDVQAKAGSARGCYERALRANSNLSGTMRVNLVVDANGVICSAGISADTVGAGDVSSCVLSLFRGQRVSPPTGGCVSMSVPLNFQPKTK